jgi:hypothetical protein
MRDPGRPGAARGWSCTGLLSMNRQPFSRSKGEAVSIVVDPSAFHCAGAHVETPAPTMVEGSVVIVVSERSLGRKRVTVDVVAVPVKT